MFEAFCQKGSRLELKFGFNAGGEPGAPFMRQPEPGFERYPRACICVPHFQPWLIVCLVVLMTDVPSCSFFTCQLFLYIETFHLGLSWAPASFKLF